MPGRASCQDWWKRGRPLPVVEDDRPPGEVGAGRAGGAAACATPGKKGSRAATIASSMTPVILPRPRCIRRVISSSKVRSSKLMSLGPLAALARSALAEICAWPVRHGA